jgi:hypothetical protein
MQRLHDALVGKYMAEAGGEVVRVITAIDEWPNGSSDRNTAILARDIEAGGTIAIDFDDYANGYWTVYDDAADAKKYATPEPEDAGEAGTEAAA